MIDSSAFQGKTAAYYTLGCKLNFSETSTFGRMLQELGVRTVKKGEKAEPTTKWPPPQNKGGRA